MRGQLIKVGDKHIRVEGRLVRIARLDGEKYVFPDDPEALSEALRRCGTRVDLFTFLQRLPDTAPKYSYPMEWDNLAVLSVSSFDHWWTRQIRSLPRNRAKQAEKKGVVLREVPFNDALLQGICEIYNESAIRLGKRFPHYGMTIEKARDYAGTFVDRSIWIAALFGDKMIGFAKLVTDETKTQACMVHILGMIKHKEKAPTNALIAQAVRCCAERGIPYLVYENFAYGKKQRDSLSHFKEINGFERVDLPRYYVPLTRIGHAAFSLGLHHSWRDHVPQSLGSKLREFRKLWYERKSQQLTES